MGRRSYLRHLRLGGRRRHDLVLERQDLEMTGLAAANTCRGLSPGRPGGTAITPPADSLNALICRRRCSKPVARYQPGAAQATAVSRRE